MQPNKFAILGVAALPILGVTLFLGLTVFRPFTVVGAGYRGVVVTIGSVSQTPLDEGFHWVNPIASVKKVDVRTQKVEADASAASKDLQTVSATIAVNYHINPDGVVGLVQNVKGDFATTVASAAIQDAVKATTANFTAEELITKRTEVADGIKESLAIKLFPYAGVESISIVNFDFSDSFNAAIEAKVTAEQEALASKNKLEQTKYEAEQTVVTAQAEAEAMRIKNEALSSNTKLVELEAVQKWNGVLPSYIMGDSVPFINLSTK